MTTGWGIYCLKTGIKRIAQYVEERILLTVTGVRDDARHLARYLEGASAQRLRAPTRKNHCPSHWRNYERQIPESQDGADGSPRGHA